MKKITIISVILVLCVLAVSVPMNAFAVEEIDFIPELRSGRLYGVSLGSTEADLRSAFLGQTIEIKDRNGKSLGEGDATLIGTGFTVKINNIHYSTVVMGDVDGNGKLEATDYLMTKRAVIGGANIGSLGVEASGGTNGQLRPINYMMVKRACFGTYNINHKYSCDPYTPELEESSIPEVSDRSDIWN